MTNDNLKEQALLLDLAGDERAALQWATGAARGDVIIQLREADIKWKSRLSALRHARSQNPNQFLIFTADIDYQSLRTAMFVFGGLSGAREVALGDYTGRTLRRSRIRALLFGVPRLVCEYFAGYLLLVPVSWLATIMIRVFNNNLSGRGFKIQDHGYEVLFIRSTLSPSRGPAGKSGGMLTHITGFINGSIKLGHRINMLTSAELRSVDCPQIVLKPSPAIGATRGLFELWNNLLFAFRAIRIKPGANDSCYDFIYQRYSRFNWTGAFLSAVKRLPLILEFNGSEVWVSKSWDPVGHTRLLSLFEKTNLEAAELICVVSEVEKRTLMTAGIDAEKLLVNPNGVDPNRFHPHCRGNSVREKLSLGRKIVIGFLGTFGPWHGAHVLADAIALINRQDLKQTHHLEADLHFLFIGDGDERPQTEAIIKGTSCVQFVTFVGRISHEESPSYLDACDILVAPHIQLGDDREFFGSPTKLFEYMAVGKAVIASRLGQMAEVISDGINGILVEPGDSIGIAVKIIELAADAEMRSRLGGAARQTVIDKFTWEQNAERVFDRINEMSSRDGR